MEKTDTIDSNLVSLNNHMHYEISSLKLKLMPIINPLNSTPAALNATSILMRDELSCVKTGLNDSVNRVCDKVEEHEDHMTAEVMKLNECLTQFSNNILHTCGGTGGWRLETCSLSVYDRPQHYLSFWLGRD